MSGVDFLRLALLQASGTPSLRSVGSSECVPQSCSVDYLGIQARIRRLEESAHWDAVPSLIHGQLHTVCGKIKATRGFAPPLRCA